jgi:hypothetical protein
VTDVPNADIVSPNDEDVGLTRFRHVTLLCLTWLDK